MVHIFVHMRMAKRPRHHPLSHTQRVDKNTQSVATLTRTLRNRCVTHNNLIGRYTGARTIDDLVPYVCALSCLYREDELSHPNLLRLASPSLSKPMDTHTRATDFRAVKEYVSGALYTHEEKMTLWKVCRTRSLWATPYPSPHTTTRYPLA